MAQSVTDHAAIHANNTMIIITTGKGGVGKTTLSAATGAALAASGYKTVVVSVDPAHSLGDVLHLELSSQAKTVQKNFDAVEVRLSEELTRHWGRIQQYLVRVFESQGVNTWVAEDVAFLPGLEEIVGLLRLQQLRQEYEHVVVDCPPTGSTMRYLNLPEAIRWYMDKFFPAERKIVQAIGPIAEKLTGVPMPDASVLDQIQNFFGEVLALRNTLVDPQQTIAQVVTTPEQVVLKEAERAVGYLHVQNVVVARVLLNRCTNKQSSDVAERFAPIPVLAVKRRDSEPVGIATLMQLAEELFSNSTLLPTGQFTNPISVEVGDKKTAIFLNIPKDANKRDLRVGRQGDDLIIDLGPVRRHLPLPPALAKQSLVKASWHERGVQLEFRP